MQQGQQTAERRGADGSSDATCAPHQVREQDVTQELLRLIAEMPGRRQRAQIVKKQTYECPPFPSPSLFQADPLSSCRSLPRCALLTSSRRVLEHPTVRLVS